MPPLFDFKCTTCNKTEENLVKDGEVVVCSVCKAVMTKETPTSNFKFIGSGFYQNDYKNRKT